VPPGIRNGAITNRNFHRFSCAQAAAILEGEAVEERHSHGHGGGRPSRASGAQTAARASADLAIEAPCRRALPRTGSTRHGLVGATLVAVIRTPPAGPRCAGARPEAGGTRVGAQWQSLSMGRPDRFAGLEDGSPGARLDAWAGPAASQAPGAR
jgi:hypothetical protein